MTNRRKKLFINPKFQGKFMAYFISFSLTLIATFYFANLYFFYSFKQIGVQTGFPETHVFFKFLAEQQATMNIIFLITTVIALAAIVIGGLYLSHRIAGPLKRLENYFKKMEQNALPDNIKSRKNDFFPELFQALDQCIKRQRQLDNKVVELKKNKSA